MLHGGTAYLETMHWQIEALAKDHLVIAPDSRGHGRSTDAAGPLHYARMAEDMIELMDRLRIRKADIVGWSDGGIIGLHLAIHHPDRVGRLVTIGTNFDLTGIDLTRPRRPRTLLLRPANARPTCACRPRPTSGPPSTARCRPCGGASPTTRRSSWEASARPCSSWPARPIRSPAPTPRRWREPFPAHAKSSWPARPTSRRSPIRRRSTRRSSLSSAAGPEAPQPGQGAASKSARISLKRRSAAMRPGLWLKM
ncbi:alpha/beta fold hydrolase [uncultured Phenylobacterium sp.]|uniref:alpha/beta fold hydrolase n=1 Tax=uncultured Phenylobacterium sp. TaxID=349273 RepID=UPI00345C7722